MSTEGAPLITCRRLVVSALALAVVALAAPAAASATGVTFCVANPTNCSGTVKPNLQSALDAAAQGGNAMDTIKVGTGLFTDGPYIDVAGSPVQIIGEALNKTAFS